MSFYKTLCRLGPRIIDDSKRHVDRSSPKENALALSHKVCINGMVGTVRQVIKDSCKTDDFWCDGIEECLVEGVEYGWPPRETAYAAAEAWLQQIGEFFYINGQHSTQGWRIKKSDRKLTQQLVDAVEAEKQSAP